MTSRTASTRPEITHIRHGSASRRVARVARCFGAGILLAVLGACGGSDSPAAPSPAPTPAPPSRSTIDITQNGTAQLCLSPVLGKNFRLALPVRVTESAGLAANGNFARLQLFLVGTEVERIELGVNGLITAFGTNFLAANGSLAGTLNFDFITSDFDSRRLTINFIDGRGNSLDTVIGNIDLETVIFCSVMSVEEDGGTLHLSRE